MEMIFYAIGAVAVGLGFVMAALIVVIAAGGELPAEVE